MINLDAVKNLEGGIVAKLKPMVVLVEQLLPLAELAAPELEAIFPQFAAVFPMLNGLVAAVKAIETAAPTLEADLVSAKNIALKLEADITAIMAASKGV